MKAARKTAVIHDINAFDVPQEHVDHLTEIFEMKMKSVASIGARSATFLTDDIAISETWCVTGYELKMELLEDSGLWIGNFFIVGKPNEELKLVGGLE